MLKTLTDNGLENKVFIQSKGAELELPGKNLFFCIFTENNSNTDLEYNLLPNTALEKVGGVLLRIGKDEIVKHQAKRSINIIRDLHGRII